MKFTHTFSPDTPPVCRLGLATRGNTHLDPCDVHWAIERGVNYLNWCGRTDGMSQAVSEMGEKRQEIVFAWQIQSSSEDAARRELEDALTELKTDYIDIATLYYVESESEWCRLATTGGACSALVKAKEEGLLRMIGLTSHQRSMAASIAAGRILADESECDPGLDPTRPLDVLMLRYNAAHRGAESDVFPTTDPIDLPVVVYTCLRWGALMESTPDDPPGFTAPPAREWYRFCLANSSVAVAIAAPDGREELEHDFSLLDDWRAPSAEEMETLRSHGDRVYQHGGSFP
jgi:aryl-alcohol dehydrogenase-like predicted oxidoreductase